jgi:hypothetical protein
MPKKKTVRVMHKRFRSYSGPAIYGAKLGAPPATVNHARRAVILTEAVETGRRVGSVFAADGTAMTAGRGQHILVYPKELANEDFDAKDDQGGLGKLLHTIEVCAPSPALERLFKAFKQEGWFLGRDGQLRWWGDGRAKVKGKWIPHSSGDIVHGAVLRDTITPLGGRVPSSGERWETAKRWALLFHETFKTKRSMDVQMDFEVEHLVYRTTTRRYQFLPNRRRATVEQVVYGHSTYLVNIAVPRDITPQLDLAMCVFHSHTVNAPAIAYRKLAETIKATGFSALNHRRSSTMEVDFARELLRRLAKAKYARWNEDIENGRWARSRKRAMELGFWPPEFFRQGPDWLMLPDMP